jgi:hypothetical protein
MISHSPVLCLSITLLLAIFDLLNHFLVTPFPSLKYPASFLKNKIKNPASSNIAFAFVRLPILSRQFLFT